jgi:hypothetical protein
MSNQNRRLILYNYSLLLRSMRVFMDLRNQYSLQPTLKTIFTEAFRLRWILISKDNSHYQAAKKIYPYHVFMERELHNMCIVLIISNQNIPWRNHVLAKVYALQNNKCWRFLILVSQSWRTNFGKSKWTRPCL